jgi:hypothetical protein
MVSSRNSIPVFCRFHAAHLMGIYSPTGLICYHFCRLYTGFKAQRKEQVMFLYLHKAMLCALSESLLVRLDFNLEYDLTTLTAFILPLFPTLGLLYLGSLVQSGMPYNITVFEPFCFTRKPPYHVPIYQNATATLLSLINLQ